MSGEVRPVDPSGDAGGITVTVGEHVLSLRQFQDLYAELGKSSDTIHQRVELPFNLTYDALKNLYQRLHHYLDNLSPVASKCSVTVAHLADSVQEFTSFEKFQNYDIGNTCAILSVSLEFEFVLKSPLLPDRRVREYEIEVSLNSDIAKLKRSAEEASKNPKYADLLYIPIFNAGGHIVVRYYDYAIAISIATIIDQWVKSLPQTEEYAFESALKRARLPLFFAIHLATVSSFAVVTVFALETTAGVSSELMKVAITVAAIVTGHRVAYRITSFIDRQLAVLRRASKIMINAGDRNLSDWYETRRRRSVIAQVCSAAGALITMVASAAIAHYTFGP